MNNLLFPDLLNNQVFENDEKNLEEIKYNNSLKKQFECYSIDFLEIQGVNTKDEVKKFNKSMGIIIPNYLLEHLVNFKIMSPYCFNLSSQFGNIILPVVGYSENKRSIFVPPEIIDKLMICHGDKIDVDSVSLPKAKSLVIHATNEFAKLENPKLVFEKNIRDRIIFEKNQEIKITFAKKDYILKIKEITPCDVCCIRDTSIDLKFEFSDK